MLLEHQHLSVFIYNNEHLFASWKVINSISTNIPLLYPLKTLENRFSVFKGYGMGRLVENGSVLIEDTLAQLYNVQCLQNGQ